MAYHKPKMATENNHNEILCRLCFCNRYPKLESLSSNEVMQKITKYLLIKMEYSSGICLNCYNSVESFHEFFERVHAAQKNWKQFIVDKDAILQPSTKSSSTQTCEILESRNSSECERIVYDQIITEREQFLNNEQGDTSKVFPKAKCKKLKTESESGQSEKLLKEISEFDYNCDNSSSESLAKTKKTKLSKARQISDEIEKKMVEFYNIKCEKCEDLPFTDFKMLNKHYSTVHNTQGYIKCCKRNIRANDKSYLRSHMFKHLQPDTCRCVVCGKELSSLVTLKHHMILHRPAEERPFQCSECDKRFCCKNDLKNHEKAIHLPESKREDFICDVCGKVFQKVANLRYHHSTIHLQERKYICEVCAKCFTTRSGLRTHMNAAHSNRGPIQCQECNKWLKNEDTFQKHQQLHQNNSYPCLHCDKICNSSTSLRSHMVKHSEERPYSCNVCRKSFKTKTHLKNHSVQHSGGSSYKCPYCSKTFVSMSNYYTHRKRMHSTERDSQKPDNKMAVVRCEEVYTMNQQLNVDNQNQLIYDYKVIKGNMETSSSTVMPAEVAVVRQNIVPPVNLKYL